MNTNQHTQGDWYAKKNGYDYIVTSSPSGQDIAIVRDYNGQGEANSRLIEAAPELLEALQKAKETIDTLARVRNFSSQRWLNEHYVPLNRAILKATGE